MLANLSAPVQRVQLQKEALVIEGPLILVLPVSGLYIDLDKLKNEATPQFTSLATSESSFLFLSSVPK